MFVAARVCLRAYVSAGRRRGGWDGGMRGSAVLVLAGWWGGRCQKASLDSREEAVNSSSPGSLSDLNTNTDVPLVPVLPRVPSLAVFPSIRFPFLITPTRFSLPSSLKLSNAMQPPPPVQYRAFCSRFSFRFFFFFSLPVFLVFLLLLCLSVKRSSH